MTEANVEGKHKLASVDFNTLCHVFKKDVFLQLVFYLWLFSFLPFFKSRLVSFVAIIFICLMLPFQGYTSLSCQNLPYPGPVTSPKNTGPTHVIQPSNQSNIPF